MVLRPAAPLRASARLWAVATRANGFLTLRRTSLPQTASMRRPPPASLVELPWPRGCSSTTSHARWTFCARCSSSDSLCIPCRASPGSQSRGTWPARWCGWRTRSASPVITRRCSAQILFREASTHPDVRDHLRALYAALMELTEAVLDAASPRKLDRGRRTAAAGTFVAVLLHEANFHRFNGPVPDLGATAEIISGALLE